MFYITWHGNKSVRNKIYFKTFRDKDKRKKTKRIFFQGSHHQSYCPLKIFTPTWSYAPFHMKRWPLEPLKKMTYCIGCVFLFLECFPWFDVLFITSCFFNFFIDIILMIYHSWEFKLSIINVIFIEKLL